MCRHPSAVGERLVHDANGSAVRRFNDELGRLPFRKIKQNGFAVAFDVPRETPCLSAMRDQFEKAASGLHHVFAQAIHVEIAPVANDDALRGVEQQQALRHVVDCGVQSLLLDRQALPGPAVLTRELMDDQEQDDCD